MSQDNAPHERYMRRCIELARRALATSDARVGSLVVLNDRIVAEGIECVKARRDVTGHAEIDALRVACERLGSRNLTGCTLYTNVEPCVMCAYAIRLARVSVVVTGARSSDAEVDIERVACADECRHPAQQTCSISGSRRPQSRMSRRADRAPGVEAGLISRNRRTEKSESRSWYSSARGHGGRLDCVSDSRRCCRSDVRRFVDGGAALCVGDDVCGGRDRAQTA